MTWDQWMRELAGPVGMNLLFQATVVLTLAHLVALVGRNASAAVRHVRWMAAFFVLLLLPLASVAMPTWSLRLIPVFEFSRLASPFSSALPVAPGAPAESFAASRDLADVDRSLLVPLLLVWGLGTAVSLGRIAAHYAIVHRLMGRGVIAPVRLTSVAAARAHALGLRQLPRVVISRAVAMPATTGWWRPTLLLPVDAVRWTPEQLDAVLAHELAHVVRGDCASHLVVQVVMALYWVHPLTWSASRALALERERACDDAALGAGLSPRSYAAQLLALARGRVAQHPAVTLGMAACDLRSRVRRILNPSASRRSPGRWHQVAVAGAAVAVALPIAATGVLDRHRVALDATLRELAAEDAVRRTHAAWSLGEREDPRAVPHLVGALDDTSIEVRIAAAWALGEIKEPAAIPALASRVGDPEPLMREMVVLALGEIEHPDAVPALTMARERDRSLAPAVAWALEEISGEAARAARRELASVVPVTPHRQVWMGVLPSESGGHRRDPRHAELMAALRTGSPEARRSAACQLGRLGDEAAVEALLEAMRDADPAVRSMAVWALDEINPSRRSR
jgi:beta-lactamase regulating signal transducer with metallopeptidase domain